VSRQPEHGGLTPADWHAQFLRQAQWTQATRSQLYRRANLLRAECVLDVGCGTGAITVELARRSRGEVTGIDLDPAMVAFARQVAPDLQFEQGDALALPYPDDRFDVVCCHFLLLWVADPARAVREMARVTRAGGSVLICAEPDYGARVDWPELPIAEWQVAGLRRQGADPLIGRKLRQLLVAVGLAGDVDVLPSLWDHAALRQNFEREWAWIAHDVGASVSSEHLERARAQAYAAIETGTRLVYLPLFYALGRKRKETGF
jgi:ubiquinone/menaquinone biosynthesis C-methylase UbiE